METNENKKGHDILAICGAMNRLPAFPQSPPLIFIRFWNEKEIKMKLMNKTNWKINERWHFFEKKTEYERNT